MINKKLTAKRIFDILFSGPIIICLSPIIILLILLYLIEMISRREFRGSIIYYETRISAGKKYKHYKFRTCKPKIYKNLTNNHRELRSSIIESKSSNFSFTGKILKKIYLDEFPQLYNIIKGDISLVGPRPKPVSEYEHCLKQGNVAKKKLPAGLTGSFQSCKGHWGNKTDIEYDNQYLKFVANNNICAIILNDLKILIKTIKIILEHRGI